MGRKQADQAVELQGEENVVTMDRRREERRSDSAEQAEGATQAPRRKKQRRRHIDPTTCERDYSEQEIEFMRAMDDYKRDSGRMFPTCSEVLEVIRALGYFQLDDEQIDKLGLSVIEEPASEQASDNESEEAELAEV